LRIFRFLPLLALFLLIISCAGSGHKSTVVNYEPGSGFVIDTDPESAPTPGEATAGEAPEVAAVPQEEEIQHGTINDSTVTVQDETLELLEAAQGFWEKGEFENALGTLDQAYAKIIAMDTYDNPKLIQQKEDLRYMISRRILEIYASRNTVVNGNHQAILMDLNRHVEAEIKRFQGPERNFFLASYKRSGMYRDRIVQSLKEAGLPTELSWLPLIESGFKANALSKARALGLWQFIPSTGYKFGLKRSTYVDNRLDFEKATAAAIAYMKEMHQMFGDWTTVLAAYNCGEGRVLRLIRSQNINYLDNFWDLYQRLPRETARYVPRFLATLHIIQNPAKYGITLPQPDPPLVFETVTVSRQMHLKDIAAGIGSTQKELKKLNPELRHSILPGKKYSLRVPPQKGNLLLARLDKIPVSRRPQPAFVYHRVRRGETLGTIARKYRTNVSRIQRANNIRKRNYIVAGKVLKIPVRGRVASYKASAADPRLASATTHRVKRGDSLWNIARRYGTTVKKIQAANNLRSTNLSIGQVLRLPGRAKQSLTASTKGMKTYRVRRGDSPFSIARSHKMSLHRFLSVNKLSKNSRIYPGQKVYVD
jgi:membrane-bound lytic murein transglycosylase D